MKRILLIATLLLVVLALFAACGNSRMAELEAKIAELEAKIAELEAGDPAKGLSYIVDKEEGAVTIKGRGLNTATDIVIPSELEGYPVRYIAASAFSGDTDLKSITIPNSVTSIGSSAFYNCSNLQYNEYNNANYLGNEENKYLVLVKAKDTSITSFTIPETTKIIYDSAFYGCSGLTSITIPNSVTSIGGGAFCGCSGLTSITIPESVTSIGSAAFEGCSGLTSIEIPNSVTSIGDHAFYGCSGLTSVTIPNSVTSIGSSAFYDCSGLTSITIPNSVTSIGRYAFSGCIGLTDIYYQGTEAEWNAIRKGNWWNNNTGSYTMHYNA